MKRGIRYPYSYFCKRENWIDSGDYLVSLMANSVIGEVCNWCPISKKLIR